MCSPLMLSILCGAGIKYQALYAPPPPRYLGDFGALRITVFTSDLVSSAWSFTPAPDERRCSPALSFNTARIIQELLLWDSYPRWKKSHRNKRTWETIAEQGKAPEIFGGCNESKLPSSSCSPWSVKLSFASLPLIPGCFCLTLPAFTPLPWKAWMWVNAKVLGVPYVLNGHLQNLPCAFMPFFIRRRSFWLCRSCKERTGRKKILPSCPMSLHNKVLKRNLSFFFTSESQSQSRREKSCFHSLPSTMVLLFMQRSVSKISRGLARAAGGNFCAELNASGAWRKSSPRWPARQNAPAHPWQCPPCRYYHTRGERDFCQLLRGERDGCICLLSPASFGWGRGWEPIYWWQRGTDDCCWSGNVTYWFSWGTWRWILCRQWFNCLYM